MYAATLVHEIGEPKHYTRPANSAQDRQTETAHDSDTGKGSPSTNVCLLAAKQFSPGRLKLPVSLLHSVVQTANAPRVGALRHEVQAALLRINGRELPLQLQQPGVVAVGVSQAQAKQCTCISTSSPAISPDNGWLSKNKTSGRQDSCARKLCVRMGCH
jgi:hypothetical protein